MIDVKTIALRFLYKFAPACGTIEAHNELIRDKGYVWYGKLGNKISAGVFGDIIGNDAPRTLLIHSGATNRYWAYVDKIQHDIPDKDICRHITGMKQRGSRHGFA